MKMMMMMVALGTAGDININVTGTMLRVRKVGICFVYDQKTKQQEFERYRVCSIFA